MKVAVIANTSSYINNFRYRLVDRLLSLGFEVCILVPDANGLDLFFHEKCTIYTFPFLNSNVNPLKEFRVLFGLFKIFKTQDFDFILSSTPKINIFVALLGRFMRFKQICNVSGLGSSYIGGGAVWWFVEFCYSHLFTRVFKVLFENPSDRKLFEGKGWVRGNALTIPGLGVDVDYFVFNELFPNLDKLRFLMVSRIIGDKGVREYFEAARIVRSSYKDWQFCFAGGFSSDNPSQITKEEFDLMLLEGNVEYLGQVSDVLPLLHSVDCFVLPSYREGMSRSLMEAASTGRVLLASNVPGCKEIVEHGGNGLVFEAGSGAELANAILNLANFSRNELIRFGEASAHLARASFDEEIVLNVYLDLID